MKRLFTCLILITSLNCLIAQTPVNKELQTYVDFLGNQAATAKDYILHLFEHNDIVVLGERNHQDITQYDLFLDVIKDPYFIKNVGIVFAEVGTKNLNPELNNFISDNLMTDEEVNKQTLYFLRNCMFPYWRNYNFAYYIRGLRDINKNIPWGSKIEFYPSDELYVKGELTVDNAVEMIKRVAVRDSLIADNIINKFEEIKKSGNRKKALVVMNYRHAYNNKFDFTFESGEKVKNTTEFLFNRYPGKVANVLINTINISGNFSTLQDGKWDAAFKLMNIENMGFDFKGSPFGKDNFDHWTYKNNFTYSDIFTGFVFYLPVEKFRLVAGFPHFMEDGFVEDCMLKEKLWAKAFSKLSNKEIEPSATKEELMQYNVINVKPIQNLDSILLQINKWLK